MQEAQQEIEDNELKIVSEKAEIESAEKEVQKSKDKLKADEPQDIESPEEMVVKK